MSTKRQLQTAAAYSIAEGWTSGTRQPRTSRDEVIADIQEVTRSGDLLAEAAAVALVSWSDRPPNMAVVDLLIEAGADRQALQRYADVRRARQPGFDLGGMAERGKGADRPST